MRFLVICALLALALSSTVECHENIFKKLGEDIKHVADEFGHDVKDAADDTGDALKKFGDEVDKVVKDFRHDLAVAWIKAKPYLKQAYVVIGGVTKTLAEIAEIADFFLLLDMA
ncbi:uncharacterized protein [Musca autumnalis]|uniref:uncharacterized protein n=1 Tax=Musca autumnalis TaxID=221902 RepID=UPI003CECF5D2